MSIFASKTVRSAIAVVFTLSAMFLGNHERVLRQNQEKQHNQQLASMTPCYFVNGTVICP